MSAEAPALGHLPPDLAGRGEGEIKRFERNGSPEPAAADALFQRKQFVARQLVVVGQSLDAFNFGGKQYLSRVVDRTMREAERAFADGLEAEHISAQVAQAHHDRAEHLARIVAYLVRREAPKFAANPRAWIERRRELQT
jgi:hypothetical protein